MEAMGLIFQADAADPEQRIEAVVAAIEASLDPMDVPREAEADGLWPAPEDRVEKHADKPPVIPQPVVDLPDEEKASAIAVSSAWTALVVAEREPEAEREALGAAEPEPMVAAEIVATTVAVTAPSQGAKACTGPCNAVPLAPKRAKRPRTSGSINCPLTGWMTLLP